MGFLAPIGVKTCKAHERFVGVARAAFHATHVLRRFWFVCFENLNHFTDPAEAGRYLDRLI